MLNRDLQGVQDDQDCNYSHPTKPSIPTYILIIQVLILIIREGRRVCSQIADTIQMLRMKRNVNSETSKSI